MKRDVLFITRCLASGILMPCGGDDVISLYDVMGPYLLDATVTISGATYLHHAIAIETNISLPTSHDMSLGLG